MKNNQMIKQTKFGWIDLGTLPRKNGRIDWQNSNGCIIKFQYEDVVSEIIIKEYMGSHKVIIDIPNCTTNCLFSTDSISNGRLGVVLSKITGDFLYKVGDVVNNNLLITSCYKHGRYKYYTYQCMVDGYNWHIDESGIKCGKGCPVCTKHKIVAGINDLATLRPDIASIMMNPKDACMYGVGSNEKADFICQRCGEKINARIDHVCNGFFSCPKCSDGLSYPSKFVYNFLIQLNLSHVFDTEAVFDWSKNIAHENPKLSGKKKYDFYIKVKDPIIIEAHGAQHFIESFSRIGMSVKTLAEEMENDKIKNQLALENGIFSDHYVQLDCQKSNVEYIKNSIMNSQLPKLLNFTEDKINWNECDKFATSSRVYEACELWNSGIHNCKTIATIMSMHPDTIQRYIRKGRRLNVIKDTIQN